MGLRGRRATLLCLLLLLLAFPVLAQETAEPAEPQPWAPHLRRAEIVATGSFPLSLLATRLVYSLVRFTVKSIQARAIDMSYAPWFLAPPGSPELNSWEKWVIAGTAVSLSSVIALIDYRLGQQEESAEQPDG